jgi:hypothetical protein
MTKLRLRRLICRLIGHDNEFIESSEMEPYAFLKCRRCWYCEERVPISFKQWCLAKFRYDQMSEELYEINTRGL